MKSTESLKLGAKLDKQFVAKDNADVAHKRTARSLQAQTSSLWRDVTVNGCTVVIISTTGDFV